MEVAESISGKEGCGRATEKDIVVLLEALKLPSAMSRDSALQVYIQCSPLFLFSNHFKKKQFVQNNVNLINLHVHCVYNVHKFLLICYAKR